MGEPRRKWGRRLRWVLPVLLAVYVLARVTDFVWYRTQRPADFRDANWSGEWRTARYGGLSGRLLVRLPDPLPENKDFKAEALVYYPVYSVWKTGQFVRMEFTGHFSPDAPASAGKSTNEIPGGGKLKFKGMVGHHVVDYAALLDEDRRLVTGGYVSRSPDDHGSFCVERD
jgi:hypothetical protein